MSENNPRIEALLKEAVRRAQKKMLDNELERLWRMAFRSDIDMETFLREEDD